MSYQIRRNKEFGYYEVIPKPNAEDLRKYYEEKYFQNESTTYSHAYSEEELKYFRTKISQKVFILQSLIHSSKSPVLSLLDIGCGEGFSLNYFHNMGWKVQGVDFSEYGISSMHPHLLQYFQQGDIWESLDRFQKLKKKYDAIWLDNVLEHVANPALLLDKIHQLTTKDGILVIEVPNDFSSFQKALFDKGRVHEKYWEAYPDHLIYFNRESLILLCETQNWHMERVIADFPIEWFLLNKNSNYCADRKLGKEAHQSRIFLENFLDQQIEDKPILIGFYEALSQVGQGRQIIGFFRKG